ncbi:hypothetical protein QJS10_CPA02g00274 [Acorus calamus]|uniref:SPRY domain-containing protein n=1 Tax=Acorus calamus TaxID=4465 RepID=A0AAV9FBW9_ACOCL|nr:hypothetical protein QJS10_CPA02g00274 [Acorus calamus]
MKTWHKILAVVLPLLTLLIIIGILLFRRHRRKSLQPKPPNNNPGRQTSKPTNPTRLPHPDKHNPPKDFRWADHPRLVTEAVEYGWLGFSFGSLLSSLPRSATASASLWDFCAACDAARKEHRAVYDTSWEVPPGSADYMQRLRLHASSSAADPACHGGCIRMSLPLPGPPLRQNSFPQEAYFEITIVAQTRSLLHLFHKSRASAAVKGRPPPASATNEGDHIKLIRENSIPGGGGGHGGAMVSLGLTRGDAPPGLLAGSYFGSIGFNSDGSLLLDGMRERTRTGIALQFHSYHFMYLQSGLKLVAGSSEADWGGVNRVIGCGFNPSNKKVFFTLDGALVHMIHCQSEAFECPLYPSLASDVDTTVLVNLGQSEFRYAPANAHRTANPCFLPPLQPNSSSRRNDGDSAALGQDDSREFFSMGRINSQWHRHNNDDGSVVLDMDGESDLFEIALDSRTRF